MVKVKSFIYYIKKFGYHQVFMNVHVFTHIHIYIQNHVLSSIP